MFVPRSVLLKAREKKKSAVPAPTAAAEETGAATEAAPAQYKIPGVPDPKPAAEKVDLRSEEEKEEERELYDVYLARVTSGIELIFSDYALIERNAAEWLRLHYSDFVSRDRKETYSYKDKYIHFSSIMTHENLTTLDPAPSQKKILEALEAHPSPLLELDGDKLRVRRNPSTYPKWIPNNPFSIAHNDKNTGQSFWDQRTIYVEPHVEDICKEPALVAHWLKEHGGLKPKWLPIQAVLPIFSSCAFVVISGNVTIESTWKKWRELKKPEDWIIMTKLEFQKRDREYQELLAKEEEERSREMDPAWHEENERVREDMERHRAEYAPQQARQSPESDTDPIVRKTVPVKRKLELRLHPDFKLPPPDTDNVGEAGLQPPVQEESAEALMKPPKKKKRNRGPRVLAKQPPEHTE